MIYSRGRGLESKLGIIAIELALVAAAWYLLGIPTYLAVALGLVLIVAGLVPERYSQVASGVGMLGVAAFAYLYYGLRRIPLLLAIFGVVMIALGLPELLRRGRDVGEDKGGDPQRPERTDEA